jgi:hypothetical protein
LEITITKGAAGDSIHLRRRDGTAATTVFPHKGPVPHDAVHFFVESELGMRAGFWGLVVGGLHPEEVGAMTKAAGHASAARPRPPEPSIVMAIQAERLVECFEADLWGGGCDPQTFQNTLAVACEQSLVPVPEIDAQTIARIRLQLDHFRRCWLALPLGQSCGLQWPEGPPD